MFITATRNPSARAAAAIATAADSDSEAETGAQGPVTGLPPFSLLLRGGGACFFGLTGPAGLPALPAGDAAARAGDAAVGDATGAGVVLPLAPASLDLVATLLESSSLALPASASSSAAAMPPASSSSLAPVAVLVSSAASSSLALAPPRTLTPPPRLPSAAAAAATSSLANASSNQSHQSASWYLELLRQIFRVWRFWQQCLGGASAPSPSWCHHSNIR